MKKTVFKFGGVSILALGLLFSVKIANAELEGSKWVQDTECCQGGSAVSLSSDCIRGEGNCLDNTCPSGTTEKAYGSPCKSGGDE